MPDDSKKIETNPMLCHALDALALGFAVLRISPNSKIPPEGSAGVDEASSDWQQISEWWSPNAPAWNVAVTSPDGRLVVIDPDVKKGATGPANLAAFFGISIAEMLTATRAVETPSGGYHLYFAAAEKFSNSPVLPSVDTKSAGGYCLYPGSTIDGKPYRFLNTADVQPLPDVLRAKLKAPKTRAENRDAEIDLDREDNLAKARAMLAKRPPAVEGGNGDDHTYNTFCQLRDLGISLETSLELADDWNQTCEPPWSDDDLRTKAENAFSYAKDKAGVKGNAGLVERLPPPPDAFPTAADVAAGEDNSDKWSDPFLAWRANHPAHPAVAPMIQALRSPGFQSMAELEDEEGLTEPEWMVAGVILELANNSLSGPPGGGKTIMLLMAAVAVASGESLFGIRPVKQSPVVLVLAEDNRAVVRDILRTICRKARLNLRDLPIHLECMPDDPLSFLIDPKAKTQWAAGPYFNRIMAKLDAVGPCLMILDTDLDVADFDEIKRPEVRTFCKRFLAGFTRHCGVTPLVTSHVSVAGTKDGRGYSGSTTRAGSFRNMTALEFEDGLDKEELDTTNKRILRNVKRNRGAKAAPLTLYFDSDGLLTAQQESEADGSTRESVVMRAVVQEIQRLRSSGVAVRADNMGRSGAVGLKDLVKTLRGTCKAKTDEITTAIRDMMVAGRIMDRPPSGKSGGRAYKPATLLIEPADKAEMMDLRLVVARERAAIAENPRAMDPAVIADQWARTAESILLRDKAARFTVPALAYATAVALGRADSQTDPAGGEVRAEVAPVEVWLEGRPPLLRRFLADDSAGGAPSFAGDPDAYRAALAIPAE